MAAYFKLPNSSDEELSSEKGIEHQPQPSTGWNLVPWIWCSVCTIITVLAVLNSVLQNQVQAQVPAQSCPTVEQCPAPEECPAPESAKVTGKFPTDFSTAPEIPYVEKYFYNYWDFNPIIHHLELNRTVKKVGPMYAGYPSPEIDAAWEDLLGGSYMEATEEEVEAVQKVAPWDLEEMNGHTYMEVGVFHNLHCIDLLRRALNPEVYNTHTDFSGQLAQKYRQTHICKYSEDSEAGDGTNKKQDHCIDHLRQAVSCHGDMTPVPLFSIPELPGFVASHSVTHTCRDFEAIKEWRAERNKKREPYGY